MAKSMFDDKDIVPDDEIKKPKSMFDDEDIIEDVAVEEVQTEEQPTVSKLEALTRGFGQEGTFGFGDEISAAITAGAETIGELIPGTDLNKLKKLREQGFKGIGGENKYEEAKELFTEADIQAQREQPEAYIAGQIGGGITSSALTGGGLAKAATKSPALAKMLGTLSKGSQGKLLGKVGTAAATGAGYGAVSGLGKSEGEDIGEIAGDVLQSTATGAALGGVLPVAGKILTGGADLAKRATKAVGEQVGKIATATGGDSYKRLVDLLQKTGSRIDEIVPKQSVERLNKAYTTLEKQAFDKSKSAQNLLDETPSIPTNKLIDDITTSLKGNRAAPNLQDKTIIDTLIEELDNQQIGGTISAQETKQLLKDIASRGWNKEGMPLQSDLSSSYRNAYGVMKRIIEENAPDKYKELMKSASADKQTLSKMKRLLGYKKVGKDYNAEEIAEEFAKDAERNLDVVDDKFFKQDFSEVQPLKKIRQLINPENTAVENTIKRIEGATKDTGLTQDLMLQAFKDQIDETIEGTLIANPGNLIRQLGLTKATLWALKNQPNLAKYKPDQIAESLQRLAAKPISKVVGQPAADTITKAPTDAIKKVGQYLTSPRGAVMTSQNMADDKKTIPEKIDAIVSEDPTAIYERASSRVDANSPALKALETVLTEEDDKVREEKLRNLMKQPGFRRLLKE